MQLSLVLRADRYGLIISWSFRPSTCFFREKMPLIVAGGNVRFDGGDSSNQLFEQYSIETVLSILSF